MFWLLAMIDVCDLVWKLHTKLDRQITNARNLIQMGMPHCQPSNKSFQSNTIQVGVDPQY